MSLNRREMIGAGAALASVSASLAAVQAQTLAQTAATPETKDAPAYGAANLGKGTTIKFAKFLSDMRFADLSPAAVHEARRAVLDWLGCALAGSSQPTVKILLKTLAGMGSAPMVTVIGQGGLKLGLQDAPIANGQMGHILDFDDTHLGGVILHTSTAVLPAECSTRRGMIRSVFDDVSVIGHGVIGV